MRPLAWLLLLLPYAAALAVDAPGSTPFERQYYRLFIIQRSTNANEVIYEARWTPSGFPAQDPIRVYWIMKTKGDREEPLTSLESSIGYGVEVTKSSAREVIFTVKALRSRPVTVRAEDHLGHVQIAATIEAGGEACDLQSIFIQSRSGLIPKVDFVEIHGKAQSDGRPVVERIAKK